MVGTVSNKYTVFGLLSITILIYWLQVNIQTTKQPIDIGSIKQETA